MKLFSDDIIGELNPMRAHDEEVRGKYSKRFLCGVDEVGRGSLAHFLCAAAVILKPSAGTLDVRDSKKYASREKREAAWREIERHVVSSGICLIPAGEIDERGIAWANSSAMRRAALSAIGDDRDVVIFLDGDPLWSGDVDGAPCVWEPEADGSSLSVAAASVMAKVHRDRIMMDLATKYPQYGFDEHMGYGTTKHFNAIIKHGIIPGVHRQCFLKRLLERD